MTAEEQKRYINYLAERVRQTDLEKRAMELAVEEFQSTFDKVTSSLDSLKRDMETVKSELREERSMRKNAEAKARKFEQQLKYAQKNKFGDKHQNTHKDTWKGKTL